MPDSQITPARPGTHAAFLQAAALIKTLTPRTPVILATDWPTLLGHPELLYVLDDEDAAGWLAERHRPGDTLALLVPNADGAADCGREVRMVSAQWVGSGAQRLTVLPEFDPQAG